MTLMELVAEISVDDSKLNRGRLSATLSQKQKPFMTV